MSGAGHVIVVGAGLAGLAAAVAAREAGADVEVLERHDEPGGATADSAGWIWRYRDMSAARAFAPHGDPDVQQAVVDRLDDDIGWLERHGARRIAAGTGRAFTDGIRVDPRQVLDALSALLPEHAIRPRSCVVAARPSSSGGLEVLVRPGRVGCLPTAPDAWRHADAVVFAGGGYARDLSRIAHEAAADEAAAAEWMLRARRAGDGSSMDAALQLGSLRVPPTGECLARIVAHVDHHELAAKELVRFGELHLPEAVLRTADGAVVERAVHDWSGAAAVWRLARTTGSGRLELARADLRRQVHAGTVEEIVRAAIAAGAPSGRTQDGGIWLGVRAGITHTRCGLRVDADGRLLRVVERSGFRRRAGVRPLGTAFAAGCDAAGADLGGVASGLAQALVLGRSAGRLAAGVAGVGGDR